MSHKDSANVPASTVPKDRGTDAKTEAAVEIERLDHFVIVRELGKGGMGIVYEAYDEQLDRQVALKVLPLYARNSREAVMRFQVEAQATARLTHEHIVPVYTVDEDAGIPYYAMKLIEGTNLSEVLKLTRQSLKKSSNPPDKKSTVPMGNRSTKADSSDTDFSGEVFCESHQDANNRNPSRLVRAVALLGSSVAQALQHAHENDVIHRDIKPSNLLIDQDNKVWLSDFGLAHIVDSTSITRSGQVLGTYRYMSPEQAYGKRSYIDHRTDIYSLGATLYELATLQPICRGNTTAEVLKQLHLGRPTPIRKLNPKISKDFEVIISRATERNPNDRYGSAQEMADDLQKVAQGKRIATRKVSSFKRLLDQAVARPSLTFGIMSGVLAVLLLLAFLLASVVDQKNKTEQALQKAVSALSIASIALEVDSDPGGAIATGVATPDIQDNVQGQHVLMDAIDVNHELKTVYLEQDYPGQIAWNPDLELLLVCTDHLQFAANEKAWFVETASRQLSGTLDSKDPVTSAAFSPVGGLLLTTGASFGPKTADSFSQCEFTIPTLWNAKSREQKRSFPEARLGICYSACFSTDGRRIVLPSSDGVIARVYSIEGDAGNLTLSPQEATPGSAVMAAIFSKDERFVMTWSDDGHISVFNAEDGSSLKEFDVNVQIPSTLEAAFSQDSKWMLVRSDRGTVLCSLSDWNKPLLFNSSSQSSFVGLSHEVAFVSRQKATLYSPDFGQVTQEIALPSYVDRIDPIGVSRRAIVSGREKAFIVDFGRGEVAAELLGHKGHLIDIARPDYADAIASVAWDQTLRFWDEQSDRQRREVNVQFARSSPPVVGYSPDGKLAVMGSVQQDVTRFFTPSKPDFYKTVKGRLQVVLEDGSFLTSAQGLLQYFKPSAMQPDASVQIHESIYEVEEVAGVGVIVKTSSGNVFAWDLKKPLATKLNQPGSYMQAAVLVGSSQVVAAVGGELKLLDLQGGESESIYSELQSRPIDLAVSPNLSHVALLSADQKLRLWNLETLEFEGEVAVSSQSNDLAFANQGESILVYRSGLGKSVLVVDKTTRRITAQIELPTIRNLEVTQDGSACLIATRDGVYSWDLQAAEAELLHPCDCLYATTMNGEEITLVKRQANKGSTQSGSSLWQRIDQVSGEVLAEKELLGQGIETRYIVKSDVVLVSERSRGVEVAELDSLRLKQSIWGQDADLVLADFSSDGSKVITVSQLGRIMVSQRNADANTIVGNLGAVSDACLTPDRTALVVADQKGGLEEWSINKQERTRSYSHAQPTRQIAFGNNKDTIFATVHGTGEIAIWDRTAQGNEPQLNFEIEPGVREIALSPDGTKLLCLFGKPNTYIASSRINATANNSEVAKARAIIIDLLTSNRTEISDVSDFAGGAFYNEGQFVGLLCFDGSVKAYHTNDLQLEVQQVAPAGSATRLVEIDADSPAIFAITGETIRAWDLTTNSQKYEISIGDGMVARVSNSLNRWKLNWNDQSLLLLLEDLQARIYPASPIDYAKEIAPRNLTEQEREFLLLKN
ncbi:MAG: serine/threonine-protein kinase [Planctomycetota bacterium]